VGHSSLDWREGSAFEGLEHSWGFSPHFKNPADVTNTALALTYCSKSFATPKEVSKHYFCCTQFIQLNKASYSDVSLRGPSIMLLIAKGVFDSLDVWQQYKANHFNGLQTIHRQWQMYFVCNTLLWFLFITSYLAQTCLMKSIHWVKRQHVQYRWKNILQTDSVVSCQPLLLFYRQIKVPLCLQHI